MTVKTGHAWAGTFVTLDATGALATPSSGPAGVLYVDGTANAATVTITGSNPYKWAVTLPSLTAGQRVDMYITATIATIATAGVVASAQADTALLSDGVAVASIANGAITAAAIATGAIDADAIATDAIDADALKTDAITKIQNGLALEATLTAIKGAGWTNETLKAIYSSAAKALSNAENTWTDLANGGRLDLLIDSIITHLTDIKGGDWDAEDSLINIFGKVYAVELVLTAIKGAGWTDETLAAIKAAIDAIDVSALATTAHLQEVEDKVDTVDDFLDTEVAAILADTNELQTDLTNGGRLDLLVDAIKAKTDNLPTDPAVDSDIDTAIAAVKTVVDAIKTETDGHPTAAEVWSYGTRTLTNSTTGAVTPAEGDTLEVTKDATIIINFTGLGDISAYSANTSGQEDKVWFTAKENLDDPDSSAVIQIHTLYPAGTTPPDTLDYINGAAATATEGTFQFTDLVAGDATLTLAAAAAADLPIYAVSPLYWDIKILDYSAGTVTVLASGEMYIYGTPTKSIA